MSGCSSCGTKNEDGSVPGCHNNGGCNTGGCNKMNVFDWLSNMDFPEVDSFDVVEVRFKGGRKEFFRNTEDLDLVTGDPVIVDIPNGHHLGYISMQGEMVRLQMQKKKINNDDNIRTIYRKATDKDLEKYAETRNRELPTLFRARQIIDELNLEMKLSDVEYQADNTKATFYYSADNRVDFRELIKLLAGEFKIRVEMRQISLRQEAGRLGGIGSCGRELCCSTWLTDFKSVSTSAARYQNLSLNPSKLSGQCGRLKCCLNYELETYLEALEDIPEVESPLLTQKGKAQLQKTDIFRKIMWFSYNEESIWHPIYVDRVSEILEMNKKGEKPVNLQEDENQYQEVKANELNKELQQMDKKFQTKNKPDNQKGTNKPGKKGKSKNPGNQRKDRKNGQNPKKNNNDSRNNRRN